ncbi:MAG: glycosyltransferase, partial [Candidatus Pacebacteria bacterium]|nr:glycosyltransferase [Candidatus Paceibacterota bacterium]
QQLAELYAGAKALLYPVEDEDFGMVPVEAMSYGTPVVAHRSGGPQETIIEGQTGVFFDKLTVGGLVKGIKKLSKLNPQPKFFTKQTNKFSKTKFTQSISKLINETV